MQMEVTQPMSRNRLLIRHFDGREEHFAMPELGDTVRIGRETDNDVILEDAHSSRYHAEIRRTQKGVEIRDVGSANGTIVDDAALEPHEWYPIQVGQSIFIGDTEIVWEALERPKPLPSDATIPGVPIPAPMPATTPATPQKKGQPPWLVIVGGLVVLFIIAAIILVALLSRGGDGERPALVPTATIPPISQQTPSESSGPETGPPQETTEPTEEKAEPLPVVTVEDVKVAPLLTGGLPSPKKGRIILRLRVENLGTGDLTVGTGQFELLDDSGIVLEEAGKGLSLEALQQIGVPDRYDDLTLKPGGSVPESLTYIADTKKYHFFLKYSPPDMEPITLDLGTVNVEQAVAELLGTPTVGGGVIVMAPTPTSVRPAASPSSVPASSLVGKIAYPVFDGQKFSIYIGNADGSGNSFYRERASQPQFSPDGTRIAFRVWDDGVFTANVGGGGDTLVSGFVEDLLPTWSPDGSEIIFLSRKQGHRPSELYIAPSMGGAEARFLGDGEYPAWHSSGALFFKGWETTGVGLRSSNRDFEDLTEITSDETDTAPAPSPDGSKIAFMSRRSGNWDVYVVDSDGKNLVQITTDEAEDGLPAWSPDGRVIAFVSNRGGPWAVWAVTAEGKGARVLFTMEGSPDGFIGGSPSPSSRGWAEERISWTK